MDVSIIIVNYNTNEITLECIDSILKASPKINYEIIVVDNASTDGSVEVLKKVRGDKIKVIFNEENVGFSKANNIGINEALSQYILLLNSDTQVTRGAIEKLVDFAKHTPGVGLVVPKLLNIDGSPQASIFRFPTLVRAMKEYWYGQKNILDKYYPKSEKPTMVEVAVGAAWLMTPRVRKEVGLLDERYFMYFEDFEYCRKVWKSGLKIWYLPDVLIYHHHGASGKKNGEDSNQWRRLIRSSKIYHGIFMHYLINFVIWSGQKMRSL